MKKLVEFVKNPSWLKLKWAILTYVAGDTPVVINMEFVSHPVLEFKGPSHGTLISKVTITNNGDSPAIKMGSVS